MRDDLQPMTWDQAHILRLATARAFVRFDIPAATVRRWAADGLIHAAGKAPGGAHLYEIAAVSAVADRPRGRPGRPATRPQSLRTTA